MQFLLAGYKSGKEGEVMVPLTASIKPPHASRLKVFILVTIVEKVFWNTYFRNVFHRNVVRIRYDIDKSIRLMY